jgi:hypothetical protein
MWDLPAPKPVKLICGILASDAAALEAARDLLTRTLGRADCVSQIWPFDMTAYYAEQAGPEILRQFVAFEQLIDPGRLAAVKHTTNRLEQRLAHTLQRPWPRPVNFDPGLIEPSKLVLASTKNFAHRVYIGDRMYAEVTMTYVRGTWQTFPFTFPDFKSGRYDAFFNIVRQRLVEQQKQTPPQEA